MRPALSILKQVYKDGPDAQSYYLFRREQILLEYKYLNSSSYWTRLWVVQEVLKAINLRLHAGTLKADWESYVDTLLLLKDAVSTRKEMIIEIMYQAQYIFQDGAGKETRHPIRRAFHFLGDLDCSDPRDKIYALLCIVQLPSVQADYTKTSEQLYEVLVELQLT
jgi:hypothetical protein